MATAFMDNTRGELLATDYSTANIMTINKYIGDAFICNAILSVGVDVKLIPELYDMITLLTRGDHTIDVHKYYRTSSRLRLNGSSDIKDRDMLGLM